MLHCFICWEYWREQCAFIGCIVTLSVKVVNIIIYIYSKSINITVIPKTDWYRYTLGFDVCYSDVNVTLSTLYSYAVAICLVILVFVRIVMKLLKELEQWFPKWAVPSPGGRWDYLRGRWRWAPPSELFAYLRLTRLEPRSKHLPRFGFKVLLLLSLSKLFPLVTFVCIYDSELSQVTRWPIIGNSYWFSYKLVTVHLW
jgi:hypothetical protein